MNAQNKSAIPFGLTAKCRYNYPLNAQVPNNKANKNPVITNAEKRAISGWVLVAVEAEVRLYNAPTCI